MAHLSESYIESWRISEEHLYKHHHVYLETWIHGNASYISGGVVSIGLWASGASLGTTLIGGIAVALVVDYGAHHLVQTVGIHQGAQVDYRQNATKISGRGHKTQIHTTVSFPCAAIEKIESKEQVWKNFGLQVVGWQQRGYTGKLSGEYVSEDEFREISGFDAFRGSSR